MLMKYLHGHDDQGTLLRRLVASNRTGVLNVTETTGIAWVDLVTDWVGALFLDDLPISVRPALTYPNVNLREALAMPDGRYPLLPRPAGPDSFTLSSSLWSSAPDYYIITPPAAGGGIAVNVSGPEGGPTGSASGLRVLLVRLD